MKLDDPRRKRNDRCLYTKLEMKLTAKICQEVPALALTVIAYQASHMAYLSKLEKALEQDKALPPEQRERGMAVVKSLRYDWGGDNFIENILPAIALHYYENHNRTLGEKPTQQDFSQGIAFAVKNGMFRNDVKGPDGATRSFTCPAKGIVTRMSMPLEHEKLAAQAQGKPEATEHHSAVGIGLFHVFREVDKALETGSHAAQESKKDIDKMASAALVERI